MKRIGILFTVMSLVSLGMNAQRNLVGTYQDEAGCLIKITASHFYYIEPQYELAYWDNDTLAICSYERINDEFIELNSQSPYQIIATGYSVSKKYVEGLSEDSIEICFQIPYDRGKLNVSIQSVDIYPVKEYELSYSQSDYKIQIPKGIEKISYSISPTETDMVSHEVWGMNYGILYILSEYIEVGNGINHLDINIPSLINSFFEKYYVHGEYARILGDTIIWKGRKFIKKSK